MASFFKTFGKGVLAIILIPLFIVLLAVVGVVGIIGFLVMSIKGLIMFFTGRSLYDDLPEDKHAKETILRLKHQINPQNQETVITPERPQIPNEDPFYIPEYIRETPIDDSDKQIGMNKEEPYIEELLPSNNAPEKEISLGEETKDETIQPLSREETPEEIEESFAAPILEEENTKEEGFAKEIEKPRPEIPSQNFFNMEEKEINEEPTIFDDEEGSTNFRL